jgi:hypothetical protein
MQIVVLKSAQKNKQAKLLKRECRKGKGPALTPPKKPKIVWDYALIDIRTLSTAH